MPSKNTIKKFSVEQMWHVYNRGNGKIDIFLDDRDYEVFLSFLKCALQPDIDADTKKQVEQFVKLANLRRLRLFDEVKLVSYCLMPNHFHLQLYQYTEDGISKLMRSIMTGYVTYFNSRYNRSGRLFEGVYKGSCINSEPYWTHISRYIHLNPNDIKDVDFRRYDYSSYKYYVQDERPLWLNPGMSLDQFSSAVAYEKFCLEYLGRRSDLKELKGLVADR